MLPGPGGLQPRCPITQDPQTAVRETAVILMYLRPSYSVHMPKWKVPTSAFHSMEV